MNAHASAPQGADDDLRLVMYAPDDGGVNDHCLVRGDDGSHYFFIHCEYEKWDGVSTTASSQIGHAVSPDLYRWERFNDRCAVDASRFPWFDVNAPDSYIYDCRDPDP